MKKVILPLLISSLYFIGTSTAAMEGGSNPNDKDRGSPRMSATAASSLRSMDGDRSEPPPIALSTREQEELFLRQFFPKNPHRQLELTFALDDSSWDPEAPLNHDRELLVAKYASRLQAAIDADPMLRENNPPLLLSSSIPIAAAPPHMEPPRGAPRGAPLPVLLIHDVAPKMPVYDEKTFKEKGIPEELVFYGARVYANLFHQSRHGGGPPVTIDSLTSSLIQHSNENLLGWSVDTLKRVARHIVDLDDLFSPRSGRPSPRPDGPSPRSGRPSPRSDRPSPRPDGPLPPPGDAEKK